MGFLTIPSELIQVGKALKKEIFLKTKDNFDDHETRINAVEAGGGGQVLFNQIVDMQAIARAGEIRHYLLSDSQISDRFSSEDWDLIEGQDVTGKKLETLYGATLPDARGEFLRSLDNGRGVDSGRVMGSYQVDDNKAHTHTTSIPHGYSLSSSFGLTPEHSVSSANHLSSSTGSESRPKNIAVNTAIKEDEDFTQLLIARAPFGMSVTSATIATLDNIGTSGTLEIDLLSGSGLGTVTTMLNSNIAIAQALGANYTSSEASFSDNSLSQGDYIVVDLKGLQVGQSRFFINVYGESA